MADETYEAYARRIGITDPKKLELARRLDARGANPSSHELTALQNEMQQNARKTVRTRTTDLIINGMRYGAGLYI